MDRLYIRGIMSSNRYAFSGYYRYAGFRCDLNDLMRYYPVSENLSAQNVCNIYNVGCNFDARRCGSIADIFNKWFLDNADRVEYG